MKLRCIEIEVADFTALIGRNDIGCKSGDAPNVRVTCEFDELPTSVVLDDQYETNLSDEKQLLANGRLHITKKYDFSKRRIVADTFEVQPSRLRWGFSYQ